MYQDHVIRNAILVEMAQVSRALVVTSLRSREESSNDCDQDDGSGGGRLWVLVFLSLESLFSCVIVFLHDLS